MSKLNFSFGFFFILEEYNFPIGQTQVSNHEWWEALHSSSKLNYWASILIIEWFVHGLSTLFSIYIEINNIYLIKLISFFYFFSDESSKTIWTLLNAQCIKGTIYVEDQESDKCFYSKVNNIQRNVGGSSRLSICSRRLRKKKREDLPYIYTYRVDYDERKWICFIFSFTVIYIDRMKRKGDVQFGSDLGLEGHWRSWQGCW
jgi:hypothetical protein